MNIKTHRGIRADFGWIIWRHFCYLHGNAMPFQRGRDMAKVWIAMNHATVINHAAKDPEHKKELKQIKINYGVLLRSVRST